MSRLPYDASDALTVDRLKEVMDFLRAKRISPADVFAFAHALDVMSDAEETAKEQFEEDGETTWSIADQFEVEWELKFEDGRDEMCDQLSLVHNWLVKMGHIKEGDAP